MNFELNERNVTKRSNDKWNCYIKSLRILARDNICVRIRFERNSCKMDDKKNSIRKEIRIDMIIMDDSMVCYYWYAYNILHRDSCEWEWTYIQCLQMACLYIRNIWMLFCVSYKSHKWFMSFMENLWKIVVTHQTGRASEYFAIVLLLLLWVCRGREKELKIEPESMQVYVMYDT